MKQLPYARAVRERLRTGEVMPRAGTLHLITGPGGWDYASSCEAARVPFVRLFNDDDPSKYDWGIFSYFDMAIIVGDTSEADVPAAYCLSQGVKIVVATNYDLSSHQTYWPERIAL